MISRNLTTLVCMNIGLSLVAGVFAAPAAVFAKDYYASAQSGSDANPGSEQQPFLTLEKGVSVLNPGDTLVVRGGTYHRATADWSPPSGTSWEQAVTIRASHGEQVIVKPLPGATTFEFRQGSHYIIMDGLTIDAKGGHDAIRMGPTGHHIRIMNSEIKNAPRNGIQVSEGEFHEFINLSIHDNDGAFNPGKPLQSYGIYMPGDNNLVKGCSIYRNAGYGIHVFHSSGTPSHNTIVNNMVYDNDSIGIGIYRGTDNLVANNVIWGNSHGIHLDYGASKTKLYHNTVYGNDTNEILLGDSSSDSTVINNMLVSTQPDPALIVSNGSGASTISNNLIVGTDPGNLLKVWDANAFLSGNLVGAAFEPKLRDPAELDFRLGEGSSAIDAGVVVEAVKTDYAGVSRSQGALPDIGAFEFGGTAPVVDPPVVDPPVVTSPPSACSTCPLFSRLIEAEDMTLQEPMILGTDADASHEGYITPSGVGASTNPISEASVAVNLPADDVYYLWARMNGPSVSEDALYVGINDVLDRVFPTTTGAYEWIKVEIHHGSNDFGFALTAGENIVSAAHGESGARLDALFISNDPDADPNAAPPDVPAEECPDEDGDGVCDVTCNKDAQGTTTCEGTGPVTCVEESEGGTVCSGGSGEITCSDNGDGIYSCEVGDTLSGCSAMGGASWLALLALGLAWPRRRRRASIPQPQPCSHRDNASGDNQ
ncbi:MAG: right-handed parallel beta-helix repeat-containing protein [Myxococcota bacterium]